MGDYSQIEQGSTDGSSTKQDAFSVSVIQDTFEYSHINHEVSKNIRTSARALYENIDMVVAIYSLSDPTSIHNLLSGTAKLIDTVIAARQSGEPVDTMVFLDKSARNGAYLFRTLWEELGKRGEIPPGETVPEIRFLNIGQDDQEKYSSESALVLLRKLVGKQKYENKHILVIDEFSSSGKTLQQGVQTIEEICGAKTTGTVQFSSVPPWYNDHQGVLGVRDGIYNYHFSRVVSMMEDATFAELEFLVDVSEKQSEKQFLEVLSFFSIRNKEEREPASVAAEYVSLNPDSTLTERELTALYSMFGSHQLSQNESQELWNYIKTAGGFFTRPLSDPEEHKNFHLYREALKQIVQLYMEKRDEIKRKSTGSSQIYYGTSSGN